MDVLTIQWGWIGGYKTKISPIPPTPVPVVREEPKRWPGPSIVIYKEPIDNYDTYYFRQRREEDEIIIL